MAALTIQHHHRTWLATPQPPLRQLAHIKLTSRTPCFPRLLHVLIVTQLLAQLMPLVISMELLKSSLGLGPSLTTPNQPGTMAMQAALIPTVMEPPLRAAKPPLPNGHWWISPKLHAIPVMEWAQKPCVLVQSILLALTVPFVMIRLMLITGL